MSVFDLSSLLSLHLYFIGVLEIASGHCLAVTRWSQPCQSLLDVIGIVQKLAALLSLKETPLLIELMPADIIGQRI